MTKPVTRAMAVNCLLARISEIAVFRCPVCLAPLLPGQKIQFDHIHSDAMGGAHEYQNLRPIHYDPCHKAKSKRDVAAIAKVDRLLGLTCNGPKKKIANRGFDKTRSRTFAGQVIQRTE